MNRCLFEPLKRIEERSDAAGVGHYQFHRQTLA